jgi:hypothetical protein
MGGYIEGIESGSKTVMVNFPRLKESCEFLLSVDEAGLTFSGKVPLKVRESEPFVFHPDEGQTWWMRVDSPLSEFQSGKFSARARRVRVHHEVDYLTEDVRKALDKFGETWFGSLTPLVTVSGSQIFRQVLLTVSGPIPKFFHGKLGKRIQNEILGRLPQEHEMDHPCASLTSSCSLDDSKGNATLKILASIY